VRASWAVLLASLREKIISKKQRCVSSLNERNREKKGHDLRRGGAAEKENKTKKKALLEKKRCLQRGGGTAKKNVEHPVFAGRRLTLWNHNHIS
jgi:hypothetical protein